MALERFDPQAQLSNVKKVFSGVTEMPKLVEQPPRDTNVRSVYPIDKSVIQQRRREMTPAKTDDPIVSYLNNNAPEGFMVDIPKAEKLLRFVKQENPDLQGEEVVKKAVEYLPSVQEYENEQRVAKQPKPTYIEKSQKNITDGVNALTVNKNSSNPFVRAGKTVLGTGVGLIRGAFKGLVGGVEELVNDSKNIIADETKKPIEKFNQILLGEGIGDFIGKNIIGETFGGAISGLYNGFTNEKEREGINDSMGEGVKEVFEGYIKGTKAEDVLQKFQALPEKDQKELTDLLGYALSYTNFYGLGKGTEIAKDVGGDVIEQGTKQLTKATGLLSKVTQPVIDATVGLQDDISKRLVNSAETSVSQALRPTGKKMKQLTERISPEFLKKGIRGSQDSMLELATRNKNKFGSMIDDALEAGALDEVTIPRNVVDKVLHEAKLTTMVENKVVNDTKYKVVSSLQDMISQFPEAIQGTEARAVKKILDDIVYATKGGIGSEDLTYKNGLVKTMTDSLRDELSKAAPDLAMLNKEFSFYKTLETVLDATVTRTKPQSGMLRQVGATMFASNQQSGVTDKILGYIGTKVFLDATNSATRNTISAQLKYKLAKAIAMGDPYAVNAVVKTINSQYNAGLPEMKALPAPVASTIPEGGLPQGVNPVQPLGRTKQVLETGMENVKQPSPLVKSIAQEPKKPIVKADTQKLAPKAKKPLIKATPLSKVDDALPVGEKMKQSAKSLESADLTSSIKKAKAEGKTFDEFVKGKKVIYRGGKQFDEAKNVDSMASFSSNKEVAQYWKGTKKDGVIEEFFIDDKAKIYKAPALDKPLGRVDYQDKFSAVAKAEREGYDVIDMTNLGEDEFRVLNPKAIKTTSQLRTERDKLSSTTKPALGKPLVKANVSESTDLTTSIKKAKAEGKTFEEFVKEKGEPIYHGGKGEIQEFMIPKEGKEKAVFFTSKKNVAGSYIDTAKSPGKLKVEDLEDLYFDKKITKEEFVKQREMLKGQVGDEKGRITEAFLTNDAKTKKITGVERYNASTQERIIDEARKEGYDVVVIKNTIDDALEYGEGIPSDITIVLNPGKLKTTSQLRIERDKLDNAGLPALGKPTSKPLVKAKVDDGLIAEARKYKSADEFIGKQGTKVFHFTDSNFDEIDMSKSKFGDIGKGFYTTDNIKNNEWGKNMKTFIINKDAKVRDVNNISDAQVKEYFDAESKRLGKIVKPNKKMLQEYPIVIVQGIDNGMIKGDVVVVNSKSGGKNYIIKNKTAIRTDSELKKIREQAKIK